MQKTRNEIKGDSKLELQNIVCQNIRCIFSNFFTNYDNEKVVSEN